MTHIIIGFALLLLSLAAGTHLLAKTKKEELGSFFQAISWIIIAFSMLGILVTTVRTIAGGEHEVHRKVEIRDGGRMHHDMQFRSHGPKHMKIEKRFDHCEKKCDESSCEMMCGEEGCEKKCSKSTCDIKDGKASCSKASKKACCKKKGDQKQEVKVDIQKGDKQ